MSPTREWMGHRISSVRTQLWLTAQFTLEFRLAYNVFVAKETID